VSTKPLYSLTPAEQLTYPEGCEKEWAQVRDKLYQILAELAASAAIIEAAQGTGERRDD
jgi:hypothetical protein